MLEDIEGVFDRRYVQRQGWELGSSTGPSKSMHDAFFAYTEAWRRWN
jgi:hypothetical protein